MASHQINFTFQANFYSQGSWDPHEVTEIWFVLHGYGQLASFFLNKFNSIQTANRLFIAPEGLSHFYLEGYQGKVGASWMTSENRDLAIANQTHYLKKVYQSVCSAFNLNKVNITILGFSQGVATAGRMALLPEIRFERFIMWAGNFPAYQDPGKVAEGFKGKEVITVFGKNDPLINKHMIEEHAKYLNSLGVKHQQLFFEGGHDLNDALISKISNNQY